MCYIVFLQQFYEDKTGYNKGDNFILIIFHFCFSYVTKVLIFYSSYIMYCVKHYLPPFNFKRGKYEKKKKTEKRNRNTQCHSYKCRSFNRGFFVILVLSECSVKVKQLHVID